MKEGQLSVSRYQQALSWRTHCCLLLMFLLWIKTRRTSSSLENWNILYSGHCGFPPGSEYFFTSVTLLMISSWTQIADWPLEWELGPKFWQYVGPVPTRELSVYCWKLYGENFWSSSEVEGGRSDWSHRSSVQFWPKTRCLQYLSLKSFKHDWSQFLGCNLTVQVEHVLQMYW